MSFSYEDIASGEIEIKNACIYKNGRRMFCGDENYMHHMYQWFRRIFNARKSDCFQEADGSVDALLSRTNNLKDTNVVGQNRNE
jgi:hypothetical protein